MNFIRRSQYQTNSPEISAGVSSLFYSHTRHMFMRPKALFFVPGLSVGGAELHIVELRARLSDLGYETDLLVHGPRRSPAIIAHSGAKGAVFLDLVGMSDIRGWFRVRRHIQAIKPDLIVCVNQMPLIVSVLTRLFGGTRAKIACIFHTTDIQPREQRTFRLFRWALRFADALIFVSDNQKKIWLDRKLTSKTTVTIRNGIDVGAFRNFTSDRAKKRVDLGFAPSDYVLCLLATFRPEKNHLYAIEILARLKLNGLPAKLLFVGDGSTRSAAADLCRDYGVLDDVVFAGEQTDVRPFIAASDVGILTSTSETFPISVLEILAMGVPMVSNRVGGVPEIIQDGQNGFLVQTGDLDQFVDRLIGLSTESERRRMGQAAKAGMSCFTIEKMIERYDQLFRDIAFKS